MLKLILFHRVSLSLIMNFPYDDMENNSITETLYERIILKQFIVSSRKINDSYFILKNNDLVKVNKIIHFF